MLCQHILYFWDLFYIGDPLSDIEKTRLRKPVYKDLEIYKYLSVYEGQYYIIIKWEFKLV